jgi:hypothetical protein
VHCNRKNSRFMRITSRLNAPRKYMRQEREEKRESRGGLHPGEKGERRAAGVASRFGRMMSKASMQSAETRVEMLGMDARHQNRSPCVRKEVNQKSLPLDRDGPS